VKLRDQGHGSVEINDCWGDTYREAEAKQISSGPNAKVSLVLY
jgi:hypothetical protein